MVNIPPQIPEGMLDFESLGNLRTRRDLFRV